LRERVSSTDFGVIERESLVSESLIELQLRFFRDGAYNLVLIRSHGAFCQKTGDVV